MTNQSSTDFSGLVVSFLTDYLPLQRGCSINTVRSYRDTIKLLLRFITENRKVDLRNFLMKDLTRELVLDFLADYRKNGATSRSANQRLASLKSFCEFASAEQPECLEGLLGIRSIKSRKSAGRTIRYLTVEQTTQLVNAPDPKARSGLRHRAILAVLYDGACRVQELCDLDVGDVTICGTSCTVLLKGKGQKPRTVMLSKKVAELLGKYKERFHRKSLATDPFIYGRAGRIKRNGVAYIVQKYATEVFRKDNTFPSKVHCHMLRHSKAMHMLQAGIDLVTIRDFLGHEDIATTMVYARVDNRTKEEAIGKLATQILGDSQSEVDWRKDKDLMDFLESLK